MSKSIKKISLSSTKGKTGEGKWTIFIKFLI